MSPFNKPLDQISLEDIERLIQDNVPENRQIEYKQGLYGNQNQDKVEFLKDISAFANCVGGFLILGIREEEGVPVEIIGIETDIDALKLRFENLVKTGIEPSLRGINFNAVDVDKKRKVMVIEIPRSLSRPHAVNSNRHFRFYMRHSSGIHPMDVDDIKKSFLSSETLATRIRNFRNNRLAQISIGETPVPLSNKARVIMHILPEESFEIGKKLNLSGYLHNKLTLIYENSMLNKSGKYNFDGYVSYFSLDKKEKHDSYTQLFHNGITEAVNADLLNFSSTEHDKVLYPKAFEEELSHAYDQFVKLLKELQIDSAIWICLTLQGVLGYWLKRDQYSGKDRDAIDRNELIIPEIHLEDMNIEGEYALKPAFDSVWNACGYERSLHYDDNGLWKISKE